MFYNILERKNFFLGLSGFGPKMAIFPTFFLGNIKTRSLKSRKINFFQNGLIDGFGPKIAIFPPFLFVNIGQENVFYDILEKKIRPFRL